MKNISAGISKKKTTPASLPRKSVSQLVKAGQKNPATEFANATTIEFVSWGKKESAAKTKTSIGNRNRKKVR